MVPRVEQMNRVYARGRSVVWLTIAVQPRRPHDPPGRRRRLQPLVMPPWAKSSLQNGDIFTDDELHQVFTNDKRATIRRAGESYHLAHVDTTKDDV